MKFWTRLEPYLYALLRIVAGFLFMFHGLQKMFGLFGGTAVELASQRGVAGIIEVVGGALIMIGLATRPVAFICSGEMAVAFSLYPTRMRDLMAVADAGGIMPPKSTWFEPKLADGMVSHVLD